MHRRISGAHPLNTSISPCDETNFRAKKNVDNVLFIRMEGKKDYQVWPCTFPSFFYPSVCLHDTVQIERNQRRLHVPTVKNEWVYLCINRWVNGDTLMIRRGWGWPSASKFGIWMPGAFTVVCGGWSTRRTHLYSSLGFLTRTTRESVFNSYYIIESSVYDQWARRFVSNISQ